MMPMMLLLLAGAAIAPALVDGTATVERWAQWEGALEAPLAGIANPFTDVELTVELTPAGGKAAVVRSFYDGPAAHGAGVWRTRFMPPSVGQWTWRTHCTAASSAAAAAAALGGKSGAFEVVPPPPGSRNHGPVRARSNGTTFVHADGEPFHVVGTTVYGLAGGVWGANKDEPNRTAETLATLARSPFNKVRMMAFPTDAQRSAPTWLPYEMSAAHPNQTDPTRFNLEFWQRLDGTIGSLQELGIEADVILFNLYSAPWPLGLSCLGGPNISTYNTSNDRLFLRYIVARIASFRNVWWSMSNEWNQCACKFTPPDPEAAAAAAAAAVPAGWPPAAATPAWDTPIWDELFETVSRSLYYTIHPAVMPLQQQQHTRTLLSFACTL